MDTVTLRTLRLRFQLTHADVADEVSAQTGRPLTKRAAAHWELDGVRDGAIQRALAGLYGVSELEIAAASDASRAGLGPRLSPGRPRKKVEVSHE